MTSCERVRLADRDVELLRLLAKGLPLDAVARRVGLSERTVRRRVRGVCDRIGVSTRIEAVVWAVRHGLF
ncbi:LuxR C-terminal-related transcriptional regulator [Saccharomonospora glauca]|jgi:DNA-binding NarL/FixJ family response regulator|uniref:Response regulator containing a CheY-like receiver domain and an HTH DNA-binding domain n=1 Tax=Saccharomonospora glauca K62 TaxID=928724 RepID=I1D7K8_9PSEU|nr:LuxR C-terminal-related transcriptional regulator [Saccharomonospora glauca]EIF00933.1 response regulator containing a CheY-like receiver domain and an HTH DNA-binding domain [Saccharomonospora glauca K62]